MSEQVTTIWFCGPARKLMFWVSSMDSIMGGFPAFLGTGSFTMLKRTFDGALTLTMQFLIEHGGLLKNEAGRLRKLVSKG